jgi:pyridoxine 5-phosphate synthase
MIKLGVNIDHVATLRNARGGTSPDPVAAAHLVEAAGADAITVHLREDRRHIRDEDVRRLHQTITTRLNLEMAATPEMVAFASQLRPQQVTLVPERRAELTTEGGLDVVTLLPLLQETTARLQGEAHIPVSLFIDAEPAQVAAAAQTGATLVEFHTGPWAQEWETLGRPGEALTRLMACAQQAVALGLTVNAGHGLNLANVAPLLTLPGAHEFNIGHSIVAHALFVGLGEAVRQMKTALQPS